MAKQIKKMTDFDKAEFNQSVIAFLIPSSLFVSCLLGAAGTFLVTNGEPLGWGFFALMGTIIVWAFYQFICFQNKLRAVGRFRGQPAEPGQTKTFSEEPPMKPPALTQMNVPASRTSE